jgi:hypothetical protein
MYDEVVERSLGDVLEFTWHIDGKDRQSTQGTVY